MRLTNPLKPRNHRIYMVWYHMLGWCYDREHDHYRWYGAEGIEVCEEWRDSFPTFMQWALDNGYQPGLDLDRTDNDGDYEPDNCRWVTRSQSLRNTRANRLITLWGETKPVIAWLEDERVTVTVAPVTVYRRLAEGWEPEQALTCGKNRRYQRKARQM